jgi:hypothetical protein
MPKRVVPRTKIECWLPITTVRMISDRADAEGIKPSRWLSTHLPSLIEGVEQSNSTQALAARVRFPHEVRSR